MANEELAHAGVKGMKWGIRKREANTRIKRYGDSKGKAIAVEGGKVAGALVLANVGTLAISQLTGHNSIAVGLAAILGTGAILYTGATSVRNTVDIARTDRKNGGTIDVKRD